MVTTSFGLHAKRFSFLFFLKNVFFLMFLFVVVYSESSSKQIEFQQLLCNASILPVLNGSDKVKWRSSRNDDNQTLFCDTTINNNNNNNNNNDSLPNTILSKLEIIDNRLLNNINDADRRMSVFNFIF